MSDAGRKENNPYNLDNLRQWAFRDRDSENTEKRAVRVLFAEIDRLRDALAAYEYLDDFHAACEECSEVPERAPEACPHCFPVADQARLKMRAIMAPHFNRAQTEGDRG